MTPVRTSVTIGLLGPIAVDSGSGMREVPGTRARRLLAALALDAGSFRSSARLIDLVWGDDPPRSPQAALHTQISRLRPLLPGGSIEATANGYRLQVPPEAVDLRQVADLLDAGSPAALDRATRAWRGIPGDDLGGGDGGGDELGREVARRAAGLRRRLDEARLAAAATAGDHDTARRLAEQLLTIDPLDEVVAGHLMRALAGLGRTADALAVYSRLRRALSTELGVDPGAELAALHRELLTAGDGEQLPDTTAPVSTRVAAPSRPHGRSVGVRAEPDDLVGRDGDVAAIVAALGVHRVVTVQAPGGAGKTRVANTVAQRMVDDGVSVFVVPLAPVRDDADVLGTIAATLGVGETEIGPSGRRRPVGGNVDLADRIAESLQGTDALLVLDNCEQIIDGCAAAVTDLIAGDPAIRVLATSRSPLLVAGERIHPLPMLAVAATGSAATDLFTARARAIRPGVALPAGPVAALCRSLDGLPLAIELAAARVRTMSVEEINRRLDERFALLRGADRSSPERHRTLEAVIEWSWELLDERAQHTMRMLSRLPAGFDADAASVLTGLSGPDLDDALDSLVNQSLLGVVERDGAVRYRMLEMVREFGELKIAAAGVGADVDAATARWAVEFAAQVRALYRGRRHVELLAAVRADIDNVVWALRRCVVLAADPGTDDPDLYRRAVAMGFPMVAALWSMRGLHSEIVSWAPDVVTTLTAAPVVDDADRESWQLSLLVCAMFQAMSRHHDVRVLARARVCLRRLYRPDLVLHTEADFLSGMQLARTATAGLRLLVTGLRDGTDEVRTIAVNMSSNTRENNADTAGALRDLQMAMVMARRSGDRWLEATILTSTGSIHGQRGEHAEAAVFYHDGAALMEELGAEHDALQVRGYLLAALIGAGRVDEARAELGRLVGDWTPDQPDPPGLPEVVGGLLLAAAELAVIDGDRSTASDLFRRTGAHLVVNESIETQDPGAMMVVSAAIAGLVTAGDLDDARNFLARELVAMEDMFGPHGWHDLPQAGALVLTFGAWLCAITPGSEDGARLMLLSERIGARRDYPALGGIHARRRELAALPDDRWEVVRSEVGGLARHPALRQILDIVRVRRPQLEADLPRTGARG
ncbi:ATP-binding protein [Williamsia sterculiae]|uniref:ATP-binding protein n=1 Tax=Williamsia sterculiae TaxID=1344003 RepID=UPI000970DF02|nr:BTAD domain-containing putative transcriptional regulator [Williamsia sterculiae]